MKKTVRTGRLTVDAMLSAMCAVLGYVAIDLGVIKITLESFPILLGALLFGPLDGAVIGAVGVFLSQLVRYGISATTVLWILPYIVMGGVCGFLAAQKNYRLTRLQTVLITVFSELLVTALNSGVLYLDSKIYGYYYAGLILGMIGVRILVCIGKSMVFGMALPAVIKQVKKAIK